MYITLIMIFAAAVYDIRYGRIPNWMTFPAIVAGLTYHTATAGVPGLMSSLAGTATGFSVFIVFYALGGMGAGDVKLMAAVGALLGPRETLYAALFTAIAGGIYALAHLVSKKNRQGMERYGVMARCLFSTGRFEYIPAPKGKIVNLKYGAAVAAGTLGAIIYRNMIP